MNKRLKAWMHELFPPKREAVPMRRALPLVAFLALFAVVILYLELAHVVLFADPKWFVLILLAGWFWWMHVVGYSGLRGRRGTFALVVRFVILAIFVMLLAEPRSVRESDDIAVMFAVDISASIKSDAQNQALGYVSTLSSAKPTQDQMGLVVFGRDAAVELPPSIRFTFEAINLQVDRDGTNVERSLSLAAAMLPDDRQGRIVLISDGATTEGALSGLLDDLKSRNVAVDVLPIDYEYTDEVWIERLELPRQVKTGETYEAAVIMSSKAAGEGTLELRENDVVIFKQPVEYRAGKNRFVIPIYMRDPGYYEYTASIEVPEGKDGWSQNNQAISYLYLKGQGKVLLVVDDNQTGDERDWTQLQRALQVGQRDVEVMPGHLLPDDPLALMPYDVVAFVNTPADDLVPTQMKAVHDAVRNQGAGLVMIGGANSFGPGGYQRTAIEEALPVSMDVSQKKVLPKGALVICLHTCEFPEGNTWAKEITKKAIDVLSPQDEVGVTVYDWNGGDIWLFPLTPVSERQRLFQIINGADPGDMPAFSPTMTLAFNGLSQSDAATKHMIIISDGDPQPPSDQQLAQFAAANITVSTVAVFPHMDGQSTRTLQLIAKATGGRFYHPTDARRLPGIFVKEAKTLKRSMIQRKNFVPLQDATSPVLKGISEMPQLTGYVLTTPKARSTTVLRDPDSEDFDPVLVTGRFGLGKTAAWTSDLSTNWAPDWVNWSQYDAFVKQLFTDVSRVNQEGDLRIQTFPSGNDGTIVVEDYAPESTFLTVRADVEGPRGMTASVPLQQTGPRRYEGQFPLAGQGRYQVMAVGLGPDREERLHSGFAVPYSAEYLRFRANPILLRDVADKTGGRVLTGRETAEDIFELDREPVRTSKPIADWFLILLCCLIPLDVAARRVQIDLEMVRNMLGLNRREAPSEQTFDALRKTKQRVGGAMERRDDEAPRSNVPRKPMLPEIRPASTPRPTAKPGSTASKPDTKKGSTDAASGSTTSRLLDLKKKKREENE